MNEPKRLYRVEREAKLAGVCGGVAEYFNIDANLVRLIWVIVTLISFGVRTGALSGGGVSAAEEERGLSRLLTQRKRDSLKAAENGARQYGSIPYCLVPFSIYRQRAWNACPPGAFSGHPPRGRCILGV